MDSTWYGVRASTHIMRRRDKPATRKYQTPWPASVDSMMSAYTQVVQQTRWWKGTQAETQLVNTPVRGAAGCRFGVLERWLFDGLMDPTTKVMVDETYKEAVVSTIDKDPRGYEILKTWLMSINPNDPLLTHHGRGVDTMAAQGKLAHQGLERTANKPKFLAETADNLGTDIVTLQETRRIVMHAKKAGNANSL